MGKKWMILACVFSVLTFITSTVTCAFIFYSEKTHTKINGESILASNENYKRTTIIYEQSNNINLSNLNPGDIRTYTFSITNNHSNIINYLIKWQDVNSTWNISDPNEFVYSLTCSNGTKVDNTAMPLSNENKTIVNNLELKPNETSTCTLNINFIKKDIDQSYNLYKTFGGTFKVLVKE